MQKSVSWSSRSIERSEAGYASGLAALHEVPPRIWIAGTLPPLVNAVSIVGTRRADEDGLTFARDLASELAQRGYVIVSGGASGIDAAAHEGALRVNGQTVAVLGGGLHQPYPTRHRPLFERMLVRGALLSEHDDATPPLPAYFLARNRLIAALGTVTVVVQAPVRSGALSTAAHAKALSKPVLAVPWGPYEGRGEGCSLLIKGGARICTSVRDVLSVAPLGAGLPSAQSPRDNEKPSDFLGLDGDEELLWASLGRKAIHLDEIVRKTGLPVARIQKSILILLLKGLLIDRGGGRYCRAS